MTWNANIPAVGNQLSADWPDIEENFQHLYDFLNNIVNSWDNSTATNMFISKTKRTALTTSDTPYTMLATDVYMECDCSSGALEIDLLAAATAGAGRYFIVKLTDATNTLTLDPNSTETIDGASTLAITEANRAYIIVSDGTNWQILGKYTPGANNVFKRSVFGYGSTTTITLNGGVYHLQGTYDWVYWNSQLTFTAGSGGSNAGSTDLGANQRHYLYIDDSAVSTAATDVLTASEFLNSTTAPSWNNTKKGWYNGSDLCIFGFITDGSNQIREFFHVGDYVSYADELAGGQTAWSDYDFTSIDVDTTWDDVYLPVPDFDNMLVQVTLLMSGSAGVTGSWRTNGQTGTSGHQVGELHATACNKSTNAKNVITDTSQIIEVVMSGGSAATFSVWANGWYFPAGM